MVSSLTWNAHAPRSINAMPVPAAIGSHARPTNVGVPVSGVSSVNGGVSLALAALIAVPANGPEAISEQTIRTSVNSWLSTRTA